jgi:hypothetical protein
MDEVYRGYRITIKQAEAWTARVTHVRGTYVPLHAEAALTEGPQRCLERARLLVDRYVEFLSRNDAGRTPG